MGNYTKNKGFTIIELTAVLVILGIILAIATPTIQNVVNKSKAQACIIDAGMMEKATKSYVSFEDINIPKGTTETISLDTLYANKYISTIYSPEDRITECEGYVNVTNNNGTYVYDGYLKCGEACKTPNYNDDFTDNKLNDAIKENIKNKNGANYFTGANPNNWVKFGRIDQSNNTGILWRIVRSDNDGIKLIYEGLENGGTNPLENGRVIIDNTTGVAWDTNAANKWELSSLKNKLYNWFNSIYVIDRNKYVEPINFEIGGIAYNDPTLLNTFVDFKSVDSTNVGGFFEGLTPSKTAVGLINPSDFISTSSNDACMGSYRETGSGNECSFDDGLVLNNFLYKAKYHWWTMNARSDMSNKSWSISNTGQLASTITSSPVVSVRPVINLKKDVVYYDGNGTIDHPYVIEDYMIGITDKPKITLNGNNPYIMKEQDSYYEEGALAYDEQDGDLSSTITMTSNINPNIVGNYNVAYSVTDSDNNTTIVNRTVKVVESDTPVINLNGSNPTYVTFNHEYIELGATVIDIDQGDISDQVVITGTVDTSSLGVYEIHYNITNAKGKIAPELIRKVIVIAPKPVLTLNGEGQIAVDIGASYTDEGATAIDEVDGDVTNKIIKTIYKGSTIIPSINTSILGSYKIKYQVTNTLGGSATVYRYVNVVPVSGPSITFTPTSNYALKKQHETKVTVSETNYEVVNSSLKYLWIEEGNSVPDLEDAINKSFTSGDIIKSPMGTGKYYLYVIAKDKYDNKTIKKSGAFKADNSRPEITLNGKSVVNIIIDTNYSDAGATAYDDYYDGNLTSKIITTSNVNPNVMGTYYVNYTVTDTAGNSTTKRRTVNVNNPKPLLSLNGASEIRVRIDTSYTDLGATASDPIDGNLASQITKTGNVDVTKAGTYYINYSVTNSYGVTSSRQRKVIVYLPEPIITINGNNPHSMLLDSTYVDEGATAADEVDGNLTNKITSSSTLNPNKAGTYYVNYSVTNSYGVTATVKRTVTVKNPVITININGSNPYVMFVKDTYMDAGAIATDEIDGNITDKIILTSNVNPNVAGTYIVTYTVSDSSGVSKTATRTVTVKNPNITITLNGSSTQTIYVGSVYTDLGATAVDDKDGDITSKIMTTTNLAPNVVGTYTITYSVTNSVGLTKTKTRTINVINYPGPKITLSVNGNSNYNNVHSTFVKVEESGLALDETSLRYAWTKSSIAPTEYTDNFINNSFIDTPTGATGKYYLHIIANDSDGNKALFSSNSFYVDNTAPTITLKGLKVQEMPIDGTYVDAGTDVIDTDSGIDSTGLVSTSNIVPNMLGSYAITYTVSDKVGNSTTTTRTVTVVQVPLIKPDKTIAKYYADYFIGSNPDNWIMFGEVSRYDDRPLLWRVVKSDDTGIKIIYEGIKQNDNSLPSENGRLYLESSYNHAYDTNSGFNFNTSTLYQKLQSWYDSLYEPDKSSFVSPINWCIGTISSPYSIDDFKASECLSKTSNMSAIGLLNSADYMLTNSSGCSNYNSSACASNNFLSKNYDYWTINNASSNVFNVTANAGLGLKSPNSLLAVRPVINLRSNILILSGEGTLTSPYKLNTRVQVIDTVVPSITFTPSSGTTTDASFGIEVTATDSITGIQPGTLKYVWTTSSTQPAESALINDYANGNKIIIPQTNGTYYLWAMAKDNKNNLTIKGTGAVKFDNVSPVITIKGLNPHGMEVGDTYTDAGATATDNIDGTITVTSTSNVNPSAAGTYYVTYTAKDSVGNTTIEKRTVKVFAHITGESILAAIRDNDYVSGNYTMDVNGVTYPVELVTIEGNTTYNSSVSLGNTTADSRMLVVKYNGDLTINSGVTITSTTRKKGMLIYVTGTLTNNGTISMTARGAIASGQNVYLWKNADGTYEYVPSQGSAGGAGRVATSNSYVAYPGYSGINGVNRATGGGGGGSAIANTVTSASGSGSAGTSYSGGSGGGALSIYEDAGVERYAGNAATNGGAGGYATVRRTTANDYTASGGAGNGPGANAHRASLGYTSANQPATSETGTGGLLMVYSNNLTNNGVISSNGSNAKLPTALQNTATGGSSGGGSVNVFIQNNYVSSNGSFVSNGGTSDAYTATGGSGGNGSIIVGYIYNRTFANIYPNINFNIANGIEYKQSYSVNVTTSSIKVGIKPGSNKYVWTTSTTQPTESEFTNSFVNGASITTPSNVSGSYYLWVITKGNDDVTNIEKAGPFNIDNIKPVITINGSNPSEIYQGETYTDAGATATDNKDGSITVDTTSNINPNVAGSYDVTYTATDSAGNIAISKRTVTVKPTPMGESIIASIRDTNLSDGIYKITANGIVYDVELINIAGDTTYSSSVNLGSATADSTMLIVKYNGNLTVNAGVTLTATTRKKGMFIYVTGTLTNNGTISMTARGAIAAGQNVYLWKNTDGTYEYIPASGAAGAVAVTGEVNGNNGINGTLRATGGGGGGASMRGATRGGNGSAGTSYSGGSGGGGASSAADSGVTGKSAAVNGGAGGAAVGRRTSGTMYVSSGGAGNPSGNDARPTAGANVTVTGNASSSAAQGTGGLLVIYSNSINNAGSIESVGSASSFPIGYNTSVAASGGSSGGGTVNVFYQNTIVNAGTITAQGGQSVACARKGGNGGDGTVTLTQINAQ